MRALKHCVLSYGIVSVPVSVATAAQRKDLKFKTLHVDCAHPIKQRNYCPNCDVFVESGETARGYEVAKGSFLKLDNDKLDALSEERGVVIKISKFVPFEQVDDLQVECSYYLDPNPKLPQGYAILSEAMLSQEVVAVGTQAIWGKETPAMVWPNPNGVLILSKLYCFDEVVPDDSIIPYLSKFSDEEAALAAQFVAMNVKNLVPEEDLVSHSRKRIDDYVESLIAGIDLEVAPPETMPEPSGNLLDELKASIEQSRSKAA